MPPQKANKSLTWPNWPHKLRTSSSQAEGANRDWSVMTKSFEQENGKLIGLNCVRLDKKLKPLPKSNFFIKADLVFLAMGFVHPKTKGPIEELSLKLDNRGNIKAQMDSFMTSTKGVFAAGDARRGQSLVVWAIKEGRDAAEAIHKYLS
tara:strand:- start:172 stop:618 length:447 start_codon:yes stop_codon:yes gene_type:complete